MANLIKMKRIERDWTQHQLAEYLGCDPKTVSRWERGECQVSEKYFLTLTRLLNITMEELSDAGYK